MSELGPEAQDALLALRQQTASADERARMRARLLGLGVAVGAASVVSVASAATGVGTLAGGTAAAPAASSALGGSLGAASVGTVSTGTAAGASGMAGATLLAAKLSALPVALKMGAVVVAASAALSIPAVRQLRPAREAPRQTVSQPAVHRPAPVPTPHEEGRPVPPVLTPAPPVPADFTPLPPPKRATERVRSVPQVVSEVAPAPRGLAEESALLAEALRALRSGERERAAQLLDQHEQTFAEHAQLARERERMRGELQREEH